MSNIEDSELKKYISDTTLYLEKMVKDQYNKYEEHDRKMKEYMKVELPYNNIEVSPFYKNMSYLILIIINLGKKLSKNNTLLDEKYKLSNFANELNNYIINLHESLDFRTNNHKNYIDKLIQYLGVMKESNKDEKKSTKTEEKSIGDNT